MERLIEADLQRLKTETLTAFRLAQAAVDMAVRSVFERDPALADAVIAGDAAIDAMECSLDAEVLRMLALHQPVAGDLRAIVGCMRCSGDIERIGDQAVNIAERGLILLELAPQAPPPKLVELAEATRDFLAHTADCFTNLDLTMARRLCEESDEILELNVTILKEMAEVMRDAARPVERAVQVCFIAHGLKRVCDQCTNIAESVVFTREGACSRHRCD
ncbi:MAG TPA: phosphate signaling complex protein PhoU [Solidesulfovibrio magneticus]|nr:phosphate signaling complex protein PhoU [Solidesulfovibrio magneticus]